MKAITISQPYASLIASGEKWVENRTWPTNYRGPIAIHAGKGMQYLTKEGISKYPTGAVVAIAELTACVHIKELEEGDESKRVAHSTKLLGQIFHHEYTEGPWCWIFENVKKIEPVIATGKQGLWVLNGVFETCK